MTLEACYLLSVNAPKKKKWDGYLALSKQFLSPLGSEAEGLREVGRRGSSFLPKGSGCGEKQRQEMGSGVAPQFPAKCPCHPLSLQFGFMGYKALVLIGILTEFLFLQSDLS